MCEICSELTIDTSEQHKLGLSYNIIVDFKEISHIPTVNQMMTVTFQFMRFAEGTLHFILGLACRKESIREGEGNIHMIYKV